MLTHIISQARDRGYHRLSLETGSSADFAPALALYAAHGFEYCPPFGDYVEDPFSLFMTLAI
jgi:putative acetyltransferase